MTINEAISRLEIFVRDASEVAPELLDDAIRLGIEALKFVSSWNDKQLPQHQIHLMGELLPPKEA